MSKQYLDITDASKLSQEDFENLIKLKAFRMKHEKYRYYEPTGVGEEFIHAVASGDYFILFLSAANGVGKTALVANILANIMYPSQNPYFQHPFFTDFPFINRGRIVTDSALVEKNVVNELKNWFPHNKYITSKGGKHYESMWATNTGHTFDIMTYDQDPKQFEGVTLGWTWLDEPPPDIILKAAISRLRKGGVLIITATPISGSAHLYDSLAKGEMEVEIKLRESDEPIKVKRRVFHLTADVESACKTHGIRGHLEHSHIEQMIAEYPEEERQARVYGKFQHLIGLVFKRFSRQVHVIKPFEITAQDYTVVHLLDPHPRNPDAAMWIAIDKNGTKFVIDELWRKPQDVKELAFLIKKKNAQYRVVGMYGDPSMFIEDQHTKRSLASMLSEQGLNYIPASKARMASDKRIETALNYTETNGFIIKPPELYIFETCERTVFEFEHYRWDEWRGVTGQNRDRKEKPIDKDDHMIENLGRGLIMEQPFVAYTNRSTGIGVIRSSDFDPYQ